MISQKKVSFSSINIFHAYVTLTNSCTQTHTYTHWYKLLTLSCWRNKFLFWPFNVICYCLLPVQLFSVYSCAFAALFGATIRAGRPTTGIHKWLLRDSLISWRFRWHFRQQRLAVGGWRVSCVRACAAMVYGNGSMHLLLLLLLLLCNSTPIYWRINVKTYKQMYIHFVYCGCCIVVAWVLLVKYWNVYADLSLWERLSPTQSLSYASWASKHLHTYTRSCGNTLARFACKIVSFKRVKQSCMKNVYAYIHTYAGIWLHIDM